MNLYDARQILKSALDRQHHRILRLRFPKDDGPSAMMVANRLDASEGLSRDFEYRVEVLSDDARLQLKHVQGRMVTIELVREDGSLRHFNGYVFEFALMHTDGGLAHYEMVLRPWLAYLRLRHDNYLFHDKTLLDVMTETFHDYPQRDFDYRIQHGDVHFTDCCQWDESDHNHLHRRWEAAGWHYWYEHRADGHTLVLSDDSVLARPIDGARPDVPFQAHAGSLEDDGIAQWSPVRQIVPGRVAFSSYDFKQARPSVVDVPTINQQGEVPALEIYEYAGAYGYANLEAGQRAVRQRMEEIEAVGKRFEALGNDRTVQPGRWFRLSGHFDLEGVGQTDAEREFLVIEARHVARNNYLMDTGTPAEYHNRFSCQRRQVVWRPPRGLSSIEPRIYGLQTAVVVGPPGEEVYTDEFGRVRVQFHWDRVGERDHRSSAWVRVATAWAGGSFGMIAIPRIGHEVIVQFLDGNPDRPLITGSVYNGANLPPWPLPGSKMQTGILSRSLNKGGYSQANAIRFDDNPGAEQLWLHAERDQLTEVENDEVKWVGRDRAKTIDRDETSHIKRDRTETVDNNETITVHNNRTERVDHNESISIGDNRTEDVGLNETIAIGKNRSETVGANETVAIALNRSKTVGQNDSLSVGANRSKQVAKNEKDSIGKNWSVKVGKTKTESIGMAYMQNVGLGRMENVGLGYSLNVGAMMNTAVGVSKSTQVGASYSITAGTELSITVGKSSLVMKSDGSIEISGAKLTLSGTDEINLISPNINNN